MKAMWLGFAAAILIAIAAGVVLDHYQDSAADRFASRDTRL